MMRHYPFVRQKDPTDCAAACLVTICKYYGKTKDISKVRHLAKTDRKGTNGIGLLNAARELGFKADAFRDPGKSLDNDELKIPFIAHVIMRGYNHYVVVFEINQTHLVVSDPAEGIVNYSRDDFNSFFTGVVFLLVPTDDFYAMSDDSTHYDKILSYVRNEKKNLIKVFLVSFLYASIGVLSSFFFRFIFDDVLPDGDSRKLILYVLVFLAISMIQVTFQYLRLASVISFELNISKTIVLDNIKKIILLPISFFSDHQTGDLIQRLDDSQGVSHLLSDVASRLIVDIIFSIISGVILFYLSSNLFFIALIVFIATLMSSAIFVKPLRSSYNRYKIEAGELKSIYVQSLQGIETIKGTKSEAFVNDSTEKQFVKMMDNSLRIRTLENKLIVLIGTINQLGSIIILGAGVYQVMDHQITIGTLLSFYTLLGYFVSPTFELLNLQLQLQSTMSSLDRLSEIDTIPKESFDGVIPGKTIQSITTEHLNFAYGYRKNTLRDISLDISKGSKIAIIGPSGCGKTTLVKLFLGFYPVEENMLKVNGISIKTINKEWLRSKIVYISQSLFFFRGTIRDNILLGSTSIQEDDIWKTLKMVDMYNYVQDLPYGLDSYIEEGATNLSEGQKQRLAFCRALITKPEVIILDEATSHLDSVTEKYILDMLSSIPDPITFIIIAHRISSITGCDSIYIMDEGRIVDNGTHKELLRSSGLYREMVQNLLISTD